MIARLAMAITMAIAALLVSRAQAQDSDARYVEIVDWPKPHVARVLAANSVHFPGLRTRQPEGAPPGEGTDRTAIPVRPKQIDGRSCLLAQLLAFDVDDSYAFDIDESVDVTLTVATEYSSAFYLVWDKAGGTGAGMSAEVIPTAAPGFQTVRISLERARLAGQGVRGADLAIGTRNGIMLCDFQIARSHATPAAAGYGTVALTFKDGKSGRPIPARAGLYDSTGRSPLPSNDALPLQRFSDQPRLLAVEENSFWPSANRQAFYVDGIYEAKVPVGSYELVATHGPEFRAWRGRIEVRRDRISRATVTLHRYADLPAAGWYSGDVHLHVTQDASADTAGAIVAAEDLHLGALVELGNIAGRHFTQPRSGAELVASARPGHALALGQEDPRTGYLGHTLHLNLQHAIRPPTAEYLLYEPVFEAVRRQGGISGFSQGGWSHREGEDPQIDRALTLLAPTGLVNFIEVLQADAFVGEAWYRLLNLGYRIAPAAGSDWPYASLPGASRNFVGIDGPFASDAWFAGLRAGNTFVSNGPLLEFTINGKGMGQELRVPRGTTLHVRSRSRLNPDYGALERLELVALGDVLDSSTAAAGADRVALDKTIVADRSMWIAARSFGRRPGSNEQMIAHSAPIYVVVADEPTWSREQLPAIVGEMRFALSRLLEVEIPPIINAGPETWATRTLMASQWLLHRPFLRSHIERADAAYLRLVAQFEKFHGPGSGAAASRRLIREKVAEEHDD